MWHGIRSRGKLGMVLAFGVMIDCFAIHGPFDSLFEY